VDFSPYIMPSLWIIGITSTSLLVVRDWRVTSFVLGIQYIGVFVLVGATWPIEMAVVKLVVGWLSAAMLGIELGNLKPETKEENRNQWGWIIFVLLLASLLLIAILEIAPEFANRFLNPSYEQIIGCLILIGVGILKLGISESPGEVVVGILTFLSGFETLYASIETSAFIAGFLAFCTLGIAILGSYLSASPSLEIDQ